MNAEENDKVFLSYVSRDRHYVESAISQLSKFGISDNIGLLDSDIHPGDDVRAIIRDRVQSANQVVVFWSAEAATSQHVQYELGMADALDKPITIVQLDQTTPVLPAHLLDKVIQLDEVSVSG